MMYESIIRHIETVIGKQWGSGFLQTAETKSVVKEL